MQQTINKRYGELLYTDTDSFYIKFNSTKSRIDFERSFVNNKKIGYLKKEFIFKKIKFFDKKLYYGVTYKNKKVIKTAGVPSDYAEKYILTGKVKFKKPIRLIEAINRELTPNVWVKTEKVRKKA
jgi:hypothetical protein